MSSLFTRIIKGEIPGTFVWRDDLCVAFMTIAPVPRSGSASRGRVSAVNVLQLTSAENMKMQVRNRLPAATAHVCRDAVPLGDSFAVGDLTSKSESLAK